MKKRKRVPRHRGDVLTPASRCRVVLGGEGEQLLRTLRRVSPEMARLFVAYPFGEIYSRQGLSLRDREIAAVASLAAVGTARPQLKMHVHAALRADVRRAEILEILLMTSVFAGFPAAVNGILAAGEAFDEEDGSPGKGKLK